MNMKVNHSIEQWDEYENMYMDDELRELIRKPMMIYNRALRDYQPYLPDYVMSYSVATESLLDSLERDFYKRYEVCFTHYHTSFPFDTIGEKVDVICQNPSEETPPPPYNLVKILEMPFAWANQQKIPNSIRYFSTYSILYTKSL